MLMFVASGTRSGKTATTPFDVVGNKKGKGKIFTKMSKWLVLSLRRDICHICLETHSFTQRNRSRRAPAQTDSAGQ